VKDPLGAVDALFAAHWEPVAGNDADWGVSEALEHALLAIAPAQVPSLEVTSVDQLPPNSLVRFRGMIQDMQNPEYYLGAYTTESAPTTWRTSKFREGLIEAAAGAVIKDQKLFERKVVRVVPVPGESAWCKEARCGVVPATAHVPASAGPASKRAREEDSGLQGGDGAEGAMEVESDEPARASKSVQLEQVAPTNTEDAPLVPALVPPSSRDSACLVKLYQDDQDFKLNEVLDFVGVLCKDPALARFQDDDDFMAEENAATNPPCSQVVRVHAMIARKVFVPCPPLSQLSKLPASSLQEMQAAAPALRPRVVECLAACVGGDALAAEYLLLQLLSRVHSRPEPIALGALSLNLTGCPSNQTTPQNSNADDSPEKLSAYTQCLSKLLQAVLPQTKVLPLSIANLNSARYAPKKDYAKNILQSGQLQLADGTHLLVDETLIQTGQLQESGVANFQALKNLIEQQKVAYDFEYYQMDMPADLPVVTLSAGKSLLPADIVLPVRATRDAACELPTEAELAQLRVYLAVARHMDHSIPESTSKAIESHLVTARQNNAKLTEKDFHRWLTLVRLASLSFGEAELTLQRWEHIQQMESTREERLRVC